MQQPAGNKLEPLEGIKASTWSDLMVAVIVDIRNKRANYNNLSIFHRDVSQYPCDYSVIVTLFISVIKKYSTCL